MRLRHEPICKNVFDKKRKPFNSLKQRLQGTEIPTVKKKPPPKNQEKKSNWRQQHENFITAIRAAKLATIAMKEGRPLPPPPPPTINPDYIQCPYCMRRFNEAAAERHINFCKEQAARRAFAPGQKGAKQAPGKQTTSKKGPTLTSAVGTLLQNKPQENTSPSQPETVVLNYGSDSKQDLLVRPFEDFSAKGKTRRQASSARATGALVRLRESGKPAAVGRFGLCSARPRFRFGAGGAPTAAPLLHHGDEEAAE
uniref:zinc finger C2HC domain-containing protein 1B n=1 Tax=Euleptes europaea TaxID=460621 RepID=UPI0025414734|nr:zinc finger C2HC domain-containing protein 1B [Euleptes europaea]